MYRYIPFISICMYIYYIYIHIDINDIDTDEREASLVLYFSLREPDPNSSAIYVTHSGCSSSIFSSIHVTICQRQHLQSILDRTIYS